MAQLAVKRENDHLDLVSRQLSHQRSQRFGFVTGDHVVLRRTCTGINGLSVEPRQGRAARLAPNPIDCTMSDERHRPGPEGTLFGLVHVAGPPHIEERVLDSVLGATGIATDRSRNSERLTCVPVEQLSESIGLVGLHQAHEIFVARGAGAHGQ
jgi:hypothetical protein